MKKTVLLIKPTIRPIGVDFLKEKVHVYEAPNGEEQTIIDYINRYSIEAVITRTERINKNIMNQCPSLRIIAQHGVGLDNIDLTAAKMKNITVINVPDANYVSVAEHTLMLMLSLAKNAIMNDRQVRKGHWQYREEVFPTELQHKNVFIIGYGRIGRKVAELAKVFGMTISVYDPYISSKQNKNWINFLDHLQDGLTDADFVTLHIPLTENTENIISKREFTQMKSDAFLINVSRGRLVNQSELMKALDSNEIKGAGLDVLQIEPPDKAEPLLQSDKVMLSPHLAGDTLEAKNRTSLYLAQDIVRALYGEKTKNIVQVK